MQPPSPTTHLNPARRGVLGAGALLLLLAAAGGCAEKSVTGPPPSQSTAQVAPQDAASAAGGGVRPAAPRSRPAAAPGPPRAGAIRGARRAEADSPVVTGRVGSGARPQVRYARARAAIAAGDPARAVALLKGLEAELPLVAADVVRWRAEAAADAGPYAEAAAYFGRSARSRDLLRAASALQKGGDLAGARAMADKAVASAQRAKSARDEAAARAMRAHLHEAAGAPLRAAADLRWIATKAPASAEAKGAHATLGKLKQPLSTKERLDAVQKMVEEGGASDALVEIERLAGAPGVRRGEILHAKAMALYKSRSWADAATAFRTAVAARTGRDAEQLFYMARALARSERDEDAVKAYQEVATRFRTSFWAERAQLAAARLLLQTGRFKEAVRAYNRYFAAHPRGEERDDAEYERALAQLSSDAAKPARKTLAKLAREAKNEPAARLRELEGVAALRDGDREGAVAIWTEVAREQPLTYAGQAARARLAAAGAPVPPLIEPPPSRPVMPMELKLPPVPALLNAIGLDGDAEAWLAANEREAAAGYAGRESEALCAMYGMLSRAKRRYRVGNAAVSYKDLMRAPSESERWTWECVYPRPYAGRVASLESEHGLPSGLVHAIMRQESAFDPQVVSPAYAVGLMQLMPGTALKACGELSVTYDEAELKNPDYNLKLGSFYLGKLLGMFDGSPVLAAAAYNAGPQAVSHWIAAGADHEADLFVARIPYGETRTYVARVIGNLARYQWLAGGDAAVTPLSLDLPTEARCPIDAY